MGDRSHTDLIVIHCSDTTPSMDHVNEEEIRLWHIQRGWDDAGYNMVIPRKADSPETGMIEIARPLDYRGAHVRGFNHRALGICLVGGRSEDGKPEDNFTDNQMAALETAILFALAVYPQSLIVGHRDLDSGKMCPCFDAQAWAAERGYPVPEAR